MTFGVQCFNDSGELTFSSDAYGMTYLGKATYVSTTVAGTSTADAQNGFMTFTFTYGGPITCAVELLGSGSAGSRIDRVTNSGSTWTIIVWCGNTTGNSLGFPGQINTIGVYVFGVPLSVSGYGFAVYDASGNLQADLLKKPLLIKSRLSFADSVMTSSIPAMTKPGILGLPNFKHTTRAANTPSPGRFTNRRFDGAWQWDGSTTITRVQRMIEYFEDDGGIPVTDSRLATMAVMIECNGLT